MDGKITASQKKLIEESLKNEDPMIVQKSIQSSKRQVEKAHDPSIADKQSSKPLLSSK